MNTQFKRWWQLASPKDKDRLARLADTTKVALSQIVGDHRPCSPTLARRIELGTAEIARTKKLPIVLRGDLAIACSRCEYFRQCTGRGPSRVNKK